MEPNQTDCKTNLKSWPIIQDWNNLISSDTHKQKQNNKKTEMQFWSQICKTALFEHQNPLEIFSKGKGTWISLVTYTWNHSVLDLLQYISYVETEDLR